jgi:single-strand DNA-binding protein
METLVGRLTKNAEVRTTNNDKQVVNFSIAVNDNYKTKGDSETRKAVRYFNCTYWINTGIAEYLTKGTLVELNGRINLNSWKNMEGKTIASLSMHVSNIKLHGKTTGMDNGSETPAVPINNTGKIADSSDDLPF